MFESFEDEFENDLHFINEFNLRNSSKKDRLNQFNFQPNEEEEEEDDEEEEEGITKVAKRENDFKEMIKNFDDNSEMLNFKNDDNIGELFNYDNNKKDILNNKKVIYFIKVKILF